MRKRLPVLRPLLSAAAFSLATAAALSAQSSISIGATILPTVGDESAPSLQVGYGPRGALEIRTDGGVAPRPILRGTSVTVPAAATLPARRAILLEVPQRTDAARDAAVVKDAVTRRGSDGLVQLLHTTMMVVDA